MKEHPILFSGEMVRAILDGRKTQTRRVVAPQPPTILPIKCDWMDCGVEPEDNRFGFWNEDREFPCPYGGPGDHLWVRETHWRWGKWVRDGKTKTGRQRWRFKAVEYNKEFKEDRPVRYIVEDPLGVPLVLPKKRSDIGWHKRPSIFMPRWASRFTLEIVSIRVERLQQMKAGDAESEGCDASTDCRDNLADFKALWDSINATRAAGAYAWAKNPWVWVIEFKRL